MSERKVVKQVANAKLYSDGTILIANCRISYPHLDKKWAKNEGKDTPAYSAVAILPNDTHEEARELCLEVCKDTLAANNKGKDIPDNMLFVRDGKPTKKPEYDGAWTVNARETDNRPVVLNPDKTEMEIEDVKPTVKAGARIDILIEPWWQDNEHGKRVNASLRAVRFRRMIEGEEIAESGISKDEAISSFDDDEDGGFGDDNDDENGGL